MRSATAVIGANYGDEGKGLVVDALSGGPDTVVVRFNGGAQAGHTVVTPEGLRHVFGHIGAGTFRGASTYLSEDFILNPLVFVNEHAKLGYPKIMASPYARITTPYDMMLNQWAEEDRGCARHGSCGMGINETVDRYENFVQFVPTDAKIRDLLRTIRHDWVPKRAESLGVEMTRNRCALLDSEPIVSAYVDAYNAMHRAMHWRHSDDINGKIIFEGAQGLLLDEDAPGFPYVTRSKTGLYNVRKLCEQMDIRELHAVFVTRTYMTRHGAGPFPTEDQSMTFPDETNVTNRWQSNLRFGKLDVPALMFRLGHEVAGTGPIVAEASVAMTHVDQMDNEELRSVRLSLYESRGPTRDTFMRVR